MDILAARKKAAELAKAEKERPESVPAVPVSEEAAKPAEDARSDAPPAASPAPAGPEAASPVSQPEAAAEPAVPTAVAESAGEGAEQQQQEQEQELLAFLLGTEEYAVPVDLVGEVLTPREITAVPHAPFHMLGVCSLRGIVLPIIDLKRRLGLAGSPYDEKSRIIVVALGPDDLVGLLVDRVRGVVKILPSSVRPAPETIDQVEGAAFLRGIVRKGDRLYILLDVERTAAAD